MSKTLGNSPDPLDLISEFGADGVRMGMLLTAPAGNDLPFDPTLCEQGRNFSNKIWNALRLVKGWKVDDTLAQPVTASVAGLWLEARFNQALAVVDDNYSKYRLSEALMAIYKLIWDDFCSWYLEMVKPAMNQPIDKQTYQATISFFENLMKILHPFMPFVTEEIWHQMKDRQAGDDIMISPMPVSKDYDEGILSRFEFAAEVINAVRKIRADKNIPYRDPIELHIKKNSQTADTTFDGIAARLCNISSIKYVDAPTTAAFGFVARSLSFSCRQVKTLMWKAKWRN
jgi:valyl-tRNA synthetase